MTKNKYNVDYFIKKFTKIGRNRWYSGKFVGPHGRKCALGHCGVRDDGSNTDESEALQELLGWCGIADINDKKDPRYRQKSARDRILAALKDLKNGKVENA